MKRLTAILLALAVLCLSCGKGKGYGEALKDANEKRDFTVKVESVMSVTTDGETNEYKESVRFSQSGGIVRAERTTDDGYSEFYYHEGSIYYQSPELGGYAWEAKTEEFYDEFCYVAPLSVEMGEPEKKDGAAVYTAELNGGEYEDLLLGINPLVDDFDVTEADFTRFVYTATVKDGSLTDYSFDFAYDAESGDQRAKITNTVTVTYEPVADVVTMPKGYESFINTGGNVTDLSEEVFAQEVMLIIVEALYNEDGTRKDDFDETFREFADMYGEETLTTFVNGIEEFNKTIGITP